jgi:hypothetical protein
MAAAPASAAAALALLVAPTGKLVCQGFDLGQLVGATNDANCLLISRAHGNGANAFAIFVSAATASASAGVLTIARNLRSMGIDVARYVISTTDLQVMSGADATSTFASYAIAPTDDQWIDYMNTILNSHFN